MPCSSLKILTFPTERRHCYRSSSTLGPASAAAGVTVRRRGVLDSETLVLVVPRAGYHHDDCSVTPPGSACRPVPSDDQL
eukprot:3135190-Rhodomonas_salina.1